MKAKILAAPFALLLLLVLLTLVGGNPKAVDKHTCSASDATMGCQLPAAPPGKPTVAAPGARGVDFAWGGPSVATMRANGWSFGASYLSFDFSKNFSPALINAYHAAGIRTVLVWETGATRATQGYGAGRSDAYSAIHQANARGYWRVLYFAIDCDCGGGQVQGYFDGVRSVLPLSEIGAYGGYYPIHYLFDTHRISYGWQTYAWSGGQWDGRAQLQQWLNGNSVDYDRSYVPDFGQVPYVVPKPVPPPVNHHYERFATGPFPYYSVGHRRRMLLNERAVVQRYDRLVAHAWRNRVVLHDVRQELLFLRHRLYFIAHHGLNNGEFNLPPTWGVSFRGFRFHVMLLDTKGVHADR